MSFDSSGPGKEGGPSPKVVGPSGGGTANQGPVDPLTGEKLPGNKVPSSGATNTGGIYIYVFYII